MGFEVAAYSGRLDAEAKLGVAGRLPFADGSVRELSDFVIAGQVTAVHRQRGVQILRILEIAAVIRAVPRHVAAVDDEIRPRVVDVFADAVEIVGQFREIARQVRVRDLGQTKFGYSHAFLARFLSPEATPRV